MKERLNFKTASPAAFQAMLGIEKHVRSCGLDHALLELVKTRVSQINGCAFCLDMHTREARAAAETEQRLYLLPAWREAPLYTARERAALAWAEAVTQIATSSVTDELYAEVRCHFDEKSLVDLTLAIIGINGWNRLAVPFRIPVGDCQPRGAHAAR